MVKDIPYRPKGHPPVWNVYQRRNIHFVGRQQHLQDLQAAFSSREHLPQVLAGGGGCGKTALAVEYAYANQEHYDIIWWIRAETQATITADLAALAQPLARAGQQFESSRQACNAAIEALQRRDRWLLIFDNARQASDLAPFLPRKAGGDILITSINSNWQNGAEIQPVNAWKREESIEFLRQRLGGLDEVHAADQLSAALGDLPLAMDQAAACITQADIGVGQYLKDYENLWAEMLTHARPMGSYPAQAAMTWELSFRRIESINPVAAQFLTLCGFFAPDEIPLAMIESASAELPSELAFFLMDTAARVDALNLLERFALARVGEGVISLHGVIAAMVQDRLDAEDRARWRCGSRRIRFRSTARIPTRGRRARACCRTR
jgi:hypothetical protein